MNNIESRIESLEAIRHDRNSALPLIDYRWNGPKVEGLAYRIEGQAVIERESGESDDAYKQRAKNICQRASWGRHLPLLQVTGG